eukprot:3708319-Pleurochrysis_carterae.AAC.1
MRAPGSVSSARGSSSGAFAYQPYTSMSSPISAATASMPPSTSYSECRLEHTTICGGRSSWK